ncbi:MAG: hypothetical protein FWD61_13545 [Phycisphaerales bacterium]|nr:hypothetical protein [Phycisphaerales bacterium]
MRTILRAIVVVWMFFTVGGNFAADVGSSPLPEGVKAVWDLASAFHETTATRERICLNGLWRWQPAEKAGGEIPVEKWGFTKVPSPWPGCSGNWTYNNTQIYYLPSQHASWAKSNLRDVEVAWYQREFTVPAGWSGRRITIGVDYLNSVAAIYVDGRKPEGGGQILYPGGEVDITDLCKAGSKQTLSILVAAVTLGAESSYFAEGGMGPQSKAKVYSRGLCGDVFLNAMPLQARIRDVKIETSVRNWALTINTAIDNAPAGDASLTLLVRIFDHGRLVHEFTSPAFKAADLRDGRFVFTTPWRPEKLWDTITPANQYDLTLTLQTGGNKAMDVAYPVRFGFREMWIDGRDFRLNGSRIFCFAVPLDSAQVSPAAASYDGAMETFKRLKAIGVNLVYTHNYSCEPGSHLSFAEILRAADDIGMLVAFTLPHVNSYDWKKKETEADFTRHTQYYVRQAQNHPSVIAYAMSHNFCGYADEHNPEHMDGRRDNSGEVAQPSGRNVALALRGEAIAQQFDHSRIIYHHGCGNLGQTFTLNIYLNHVPAQERDSWFEHWAAEGVKPLFWAEYGTPDDLDWSMYRGWYKGERSWGNAAVAYEMCFPEWGSQYRGDKAFEMTELEKSNLRFEARQWRKLANGGQPWFRWDYPHPVGSHQFDIHNILDVLAMYIPDNWRSYRTWGVSAFNSWELHRLWALKPGFQRPKKIFTIDWDRLQKPGFSPDFIDKPYEAYEYAYGASDWVPSGAAKAIIQNNDSVLAYIGGSGSPEKIGDFVRKDHHYLPGQTVEKQIVLLNNSRQTVSASCVWSLDLPRPIAGGKQVTIATGEQARIPLRFELSRDLPAGSYKLTATTTFRAAIPLGGGPDGANIQPDTFTLDILPTPHPAKLVAKIALFDPKGETEQLLRTLGVTAEKVDASSDLSHFDLLLVGKNALRPDSAAPDISRVNDGLKVVIFEQTAETLEQRFGFRTTEYGLRWVFKRVPDHSVLADISDANLRYWNGDATITASRLQYTFDKYKTPTITWCDIPVTHPWRCGNAGNVCSVLIEKPVCGDFLPILDGGYSLQYSPLMEYRQGRGMIVFCQLDVTGRTASDPAAQRLAANLLTYAATWKPPSDMKKTLYAGPDAGKAWLQQAGIAAEPYVGGLLAQEHILIIASGGKEHAASAEIKTFLAAGGRLLALGLDQASAKALLPFAITMKKGEYIGGVFEPFSVRSLLAGVGSADVHNRDPRMLPLVTAGATSWANGVLGQSQDGNVIFCQLVPWEFNYAKQYNLKRTFRRSSYMVSRILANMGAAGVAPVLERFHHPVKPKETRYLDGLYLDRPEEMDDPYRFFCW